MSAEEVDEYLLGLDEPKRQTLETLRDTILEVVPDAEQGISYRVPAFRIGGKVVSGFAAFKDHAATCRSVDRSSVCLEMSFASTR